MLDLPREAARRGLAAAAVEGRVQPLALDAPFTVVLDYAHNAAAAECLLRALRAYRPARLTVLFGCGGGRSRVRRSGMGEACARLADFCILTEDNSRGEPLEAILADIRAGMARGRPRHPLCGAPRPAAGAVLRPGPRPARRHPGGDRQRARDDAGTRRPDAALLRTGDH